MANVIATDLIENAGMRHGFQAIYVPESQPSLVMFVLSDTDIASDKTTISSAIEVAMTPIESIRVTLTRYDAWTEAVKRLSVMPPPPADVKEGRDASNVPTAERASHAR
jgi:hypothetical protein